MYTLEELRAEFARRECLVTGHSWEVIASDAVPVRLVCGLCNWSGDVTMHARPDAGEAS
jgi:hypothetical protein